MPLLPDIEKDPSVLAVIKQALAEDLGGKCDATTKALVPDDAVATGQIIARETCIVSGGTVAAAVFVQLDSGLDVNIIKGDGERADAGDVILEVRGRAGSILSGERTALNFMQRMCGIATHTAEFVKKAGPLMVLDTRKTTPCLRTFEKYAVLCGGGANHRYGLFDRVLIKDNHRKLWGEGDLCDAVSAARRAYPELEIEIEVESMDELRDALRGCPDWILLDNMSSEMMKACVAEVGGRAKLEASGGIQLDRIEEIAATGVDAVSLGCLTHTVVSADLSLELVEK